MGLLTFRDGYGVTVSWVARNRKQWLTHRDSLRCSPTAMDSGSNKKDVLEGSRYLSPRAVTHAARQQTHGSLTAREMSFRTGRPAVQQPPHSARGAAGPSQSTEPSAPMKRIEPRIEPEVAKSMLLEIFGNDTTFGLTDEYLTLMKKDSSLQIMLPAERRKEPKPIHPFGGSSLLGGSSTSGGSGAPTLSIVRAPDEPRPFTAVVPVPVPPTRGQSRQRPRPQTVPSPSTPPPPPLYAEGGGGGAFGSQVLDDGFALGDQSWAMGRTSPFAEAPGGAPVAMRHLGGEMPHVYPDGHHPLTLSLAPLDEKDAEAPAAEQQRQRPRRRRRRHVPAHSVGALLEEVQGPMANMVELSQVLDMPPFIEQASERFQAREVAILSTVSVFDCLPWWLLCRRSHQSRVNAVAALLPLSALLYLDLSAGEASAFFASRGPLSLRATEPSTRNPAQDCL